MDQEDVNAYVELSVSASVQSYHFPNLFKGTTYRFQGLPGHPRISLVVDVKGAFTNHFSSLILVV